MRFHEVDMVGRFWMQRLPVLPTWTANDVGRLVFTEDDGSVYYGGTVSYGDWINMSHHFVDTGTALDPATGVAFTGRHYDLRVINGNLRLYY